MTFADFISQTLTGNTGIAWNYYQSGIQTDNILNDENSFKFIHQYYKNGEKEYTLILDPEEADIFLNDYFCLGRKESVLKLGLDMNYFLPKDRAVHTVSGFFLGLLVENCLNGTDSLTVEFPQYFPFSYLWFLTFLYHDYGYCVAEKADSPLRVPPHAPIPRSNKIQGAEYHELRLVKADLGIHLSPYSSFGHGFSSVSCNRSHASLEKALLFELTQPSHRISGPFSRIRFRSGAIVTPGEEDLESPCVTVDGTC